MICGAAEAPLTPITFGAFDVVNVLSVQNEFPQKPRPFDNKRDGFVLGSWNFSFRRIKPCFKT